MNKTRNKFDIILYNTLYKKYGKPRYYYTR